MGLKTIVRQALADNVKIACATKNLNNSLAYFPRTIQVAQLPLSVVALRAGIYDWETYGADEVLETRDFDILIHVAAGTLGKEGQAEQAAEDYLDLLLEHFGTHRYIDLSNQSQMTVTPTGDGGITQFEYGDPNQQNRQIFTGSTFSLSVELEMTFEQAN